jgi:hypothetical protein
MAKSKPAKPTRKPSKPKPSRKPKPDYKDS